MTRLSLGVIAVAAAATVGLLIYSFEKGDLAAWLWFALFTAWNLSPWVALAVTAWAIRGRRAPSIVVLVGSAVLGVWAVTTLYQTMIAHVDPQSALIFVLLPALLWAGVVVLGVAAVVAGRLFRSA